MYKFFFSALFTGALVLAGVGPTQHSAPTILADEAKPYDIKKDLDKCEKRLIRYHDKIGDIWRKAGFETRAADHYWRVIAIDTNHKGARRELGYKLEDGHWRVEDKRLQEDTVDEKDADKEAKDAQEDVDKQIKKAADAVEDFMKAVEKAGSAEQLAQAAHLMSFYDQSHAGAAKARGFKQHGEIYVRPKLAAAIASAAKLLEGATEGEEEAKEEEDIAFLNVDWHRRKSPRLIVRTAWGETAGTRSMRVGNAAMELAAADFGLEKKMPLMDKAYYFTRVRVTSTYNPYYIYIDKQDWKDDKKAFRKKLTGMTVSKPYGFMNRSPVQAGSDDMLANTLALALLKKKRGQNSMPVFYMGYSYALTARLLETTSTRRYTLEAKKKGTAVRGKNLAPTFGGPRLGPAYLRNLAKWNIAIDQDPLLLQMSDLTLNEVKENHAAKALALFEFLLEEEREKMLEWLPKKWERGRDDLKHLAETLGTNIKGLEKRLTEWIWANY